MEIIMKNRLLVNSIYHNIVTPVTHCSLFTVTPLLLTALCLQFCVGHC